MTLLRPSLREVLRTEIRGRIIRGDLSPGSRINETALAGEFGTSQTPIREALLGLEKDGVLISEPRKGFRVMPLSTREVKEAYPILAQLESMALREITGFSPAKIASLRAMNEELGRVRTHPDQAIELDKNWHTELLSDCPNSRLLAIIDSLRASISRYDFAYGQEVGDLGLSYRQHAELLDHLDSKRVARAATLLKKNWTDNIQPLVRWLDSLP